MQHCEASQDSTCFQRLSCFPLFAVDNYLLLIGRVGICLAVKPCAGALDWIWFWSPVLYNASRVATRCVLDSSLFLSVGPCKSSATSVMVVAELRALNAPPVLMLMILLLQWQEKLPIKQDSLLKHAISMVLES